jgi:hypothetical protein
MAQKVRIKSCTCGQRGCSDYWLVGIGKFVQGSGFTYAEAQRIADLLNNGSTNADRFKGADAD